MAIALRTRKPLAAQAPQMSIDPFAPAHIKRLVAQFGSPLLIIDCERVRRQYLRLQAALPGHPRLRREIPRLAGEMPSPINPPPGCAFHPRCPMAMPICSEVEPLLAEVAPDRWTACHLYEPSSREPAAVAPQRAASP